MQCNWNLLHGEIKYVGALTAHDFNKRNIIVIAKHKIQVVKLKKKKEQLAR